MKNYSLITVALLSMQLASAQKFPAQWFNGKVDSFTKTLIDTPENESSQLKTLITEVNNNAGGGTIIIPKGNYELGGIDILSNVHLAIDKDAVITLEPGEKGVFFLGDNTDLKETVSNVKIACSNCDLSAEPYDDERYYTIDYSYLEPAGRGKAITVLNAENFHISDYKVLDNHTRISSLNLSPVLVGEFPREAPQNSTFRAIFSPRQGNVENLCVVNSAGGYGVVQVQCAINVSFKDLYGIGGATLRLESGAGATNIGTLIDADIALMTGIDAKNINCTNGSASLMMSAHGRIHGDIDVRDVTATGTSYAVRISRGFIDGEVRGPLGAPNSKKTNTDPSRFKRGVFKSVKVHNVTAIYKENTAQGAFVDWTGYPSALRGSSFDDFVAGPFGGLDAPAAPGKGRINIPSIAPILYASIDNVNDSVEAVTGINDPRYAGNNEGDGKYEVEFTGTIKTVGFLPCFEAIDNKLYNEDKNSDYCSSTLSIANTKKPIAFDLYLDTNEKVLHVNSTKANTLLIYNMAGGIIASYENITDNSNIDLNFLPTGFYITKLSNLDTSNSMVKKIVLK